MYIQPFIQYLTEWHTYHTVGVMAIIETLEAIRVSYNKHNLHSLSTWHLCVTEENNSNVNNYKKYYQKYCFVNLAKSGFI